MRFKLSTVMALIAALMMPLAAQAEEVWVKNSVDFTLSENWLLGFEQEYKSHDGDFTDMREQKYALGLERVFQNSSLGFSYQWVDEDGSDHENRIRVDYNWSPTLFGGEEGNSLLFTSRVRGEFRMFDGDDPDEIRVRYRAGLKGVIPAGSVDIEPFIWAEPFWGSEHDDVYKVRYAVGTNVEFNDHIEWWVAYIYEDIDGSEDREAVGTGLSLSF